MTAPGEQAQAGVTAPGEQAIVTAADERSSKTTAGERSGVPATDGWSGATAPDGWSGATAGGAADDAVARRAELLRRRLAGRAAGAGRARRIGPVDRSRPIPLSAGQRQLWLLDQLEPGSPAYLMTGSFRLRGKLDVSAWRRAWTEVVARHEILRTRYVRDGDEPAQVVDPPGPVELPVVDLTGEPDPERRVGELTRAESRRPFALDREWPTRSWLLRTADDEHVLLTVWHHIALDGWSLSPLLAELGALYRGHVEGRPPALPPVTPQYADYAGWQRARHASGLVDTELDYWRRQLADLAPLELPTDRPRATTRSWAGATARFGVPAPVAERLRDLGRANRASLFMVTLAAFGVLLGRYTGSRDVAVGAPIAGRTDPELAGLVGFVVNTLVLRTRWSGDPRFTELLRSVRETTLAALAHQEVPVEQLVRELAPQRDASRPALFQVAFALRDDLPASRLADVVLTREPVDGQVAKFELAVQLTEHADGAVTGEIEYATALFDPATVDRLAAHYVRLLGSLAEAPESPLSRLGMLAPDERVELAAVPQPPAEAGRCLPQVFEARVRQDPDTVAVAYDRTTWTYRELNERANRLARRLRDLGAGPETLVGVCLDRGPELIAALLGVLKSGAGYLPLDPANPVDRLRFLAADAGAAILLTERRHRAAAPATHPGPVVVLDDDPTLGSLPATDLPAVAGPGNVAYVIYTSGSTGRPKGVAVTHANVARLFTAVAADLTCGPTDTWTMVHSYAFDFSVWEIWGPLLHGGRLVVVPPDVARVPAELAELLAAHRVTVLSQTPAAFTGLVAALDEGGPWRDRLALRAVVFGGERLEPAALAGWVRQLGLDRPALVNMYGITETTVHVTTHRLTGVDLDSGVSPIGRPLADLVVRLLDRDGEPVPTGAVGEIHVGGAGLSRGYLGHPALTAERFVPDPWGPPGTRLYRSGDLARRGADGRLEFLGRADQQVKIRGYRIELGEIEAALLALPGVTRAAVVARDEKSGGRRLVGYVVPAAGGVDPAELATRLGVVLPDYMVPSAIVCLDRLPLTTNGKLDRAALPRPEVRAAGRPPETEPERLLCAAIAGLLGLPAVGVDDDFFVLGGDSIVAIQLVGRARAAGLTLSARDVFEHRTVARLAGRAAPTGPEPESGTGPEPGSGPVPLTPIVRATLDRGGPIDAHHQAVVVTVPPELGLDRLATALQALVDQHDALRLRLTAKPGLEVTAAGTVRVADQLRRVDAAGAVPLPELIRAEADAAPRRLAPATGVTLQAVWFDLGPDRSGRLLLVLHHLVVDGVSWRILLPQLADAWRAAGDGWPPAPPPVGTSFRRWAELLAARAVDPALHAELPRWTAALDRPPARLAGRRLDAARDTVATQRKITVRTPREQTSALLTVLPAAYHAGVEDVLLSALGLAVAAWRPETDGALLVDLERHGREPFTDDVDLAQTIGWFTSVHPVRLELSGVDWPDVWAGGPELGRLLGSVKDRLRDVPGQGLGFGLLRYLNPETAARLRELPEPEVCFNYLGRLTGGAPEATDWTPAAEGREVRGGADGRAPLAHPLEVNAYTEDGADGPHLVSTFSWPAAVFAEPDLRRLAELWTRVLAALAGHAGRPGIGGRTPGDLPLVSLRHPDVARLEATCPNLVDVWPATPLQEGLLYHSVYDAHAPEVYTVQTVFGLPATWRPDALRAGLATLLARHPHLRAAFWFPESGQPVRVVPAEVELPYQEVELSGVPEPERAATLTRLVESERVRRFDVTVAPLLRLTVFRLGPDRYRAALTCHHVLLDGWSLPLLAAELAAAVTGTPTVPAGSYRDYLAWLVRQDRAAATAAWREVLAGFAEPTLVAPPGRRVRPEWARQVGVQLSADLTDRLIQVARAGGVTLNTVVQGAWGLLLGRLVGRSDVVFGSTVSGRPPEVPGIERMLGFFLNTVPVRLAPQPGERLVDLLRRVQDQQSRLTPYHHLGLSDIQRAVRLPALFDTLTVFENYPVDAEAAAAVSDAEIHHSLHYPLGLFAYPGPALRLVLRYQPAQFTAETVAGIGRALTELLTAIAEDPHRPVDRLGAGVRPPLRHLLDDPRAGSATLDGEVASAGSAALDGEPVSTRPGRPDLAPEAGAAPGTLTRIFAEQVARTPDAVALRCAEVSYSYAELDGRANRLAQHLVAQGAGPERIVALRMSRSAELVVAVLAVLKSGAAYLPVEPGPAARVEAVLAEADPVVVLTDAVPPDVADRPDTDPCPPLDPEHPAYLLYTSGTTGRPKGVLVPHRAVAELVRWAAAEFGPDRLARVLASTPLGFDVSVFELFAPLCCGGSVELVADLSALPGLADRPPTLVAAVGSRLDALLRLGPSPAVRVPTVVLAGEALGAATVRAARAGLHAERVVNAYGPTEATVYATTWDDDGTTPGRPSIGRPRSGVRAYLLDAELRPVPDGRTGELYLAGAGLARGYHGHPGPTAEVFRPDPYGPAGSRMYRTGDLARRGADGGFEFVGRVDDQVKIRGVRVEPAEVAATLAEHPGVVEAAVLPGPGRDGGVRLVGYVVPAVPGAVTAAELRRHLAERLVGAAVPATVEVVAALPRTPHGKLDRAALAGSAAPSPRPPSPGREEALGRIFAELLELPEVGAEDGFFDLGGHSLLATRLLGRLRTQFGADLDVQDLYESPTVADLARRLPADTRRSPDSGPSRSPADAPDAQASQRPADDPGLDEVVRLYDRYPYPSPDDTGGLLHDVANAVAYLVEEDGLAGWRVLDAGCGTGHRLVALALRHPEARFVGVDPSPGSLAVARALAARHGATNVRFALGGIPESRLPGGFDLVVCSGVLHHLTDPVAGLGWLVDRLAPDGLLFCWLYHAFGEHDRLLDRELARLLASTGGAEPDLTVVRALGLSLAPARYGATATAGGAGAATRAAYDVDAFLHPVVRLTTFAEVPAMFEGVDVDWVAAFGLNVADAGRLLDLSGVDTATSLTVRPEELFDDPTVRVRLAALPVPDRLRAVELRLRPTGLSLVAGRTAALPRCLPRVRGNLLTPPAAEPRPR
ncbi:amino acid adenylation domain-containing protein [Micromonosporaceae bacterium B7E4]